MVASLAQGGLPCTAAYEPLCRPDREGPGRLGRRPAMPKWVYSFGGGKAEGSAAMRALLGGKGANLAEMSSIGLPVPPGFTITTEVTAHYASDQGYPAGLRDEVERALAEVERQVGRRFGDAANPLLV